MEGGGARERERPGRSDRLEDWEVQAVLRCDAHRHPPPPTRPLSSRISSATHTHTHTPPSSVHPSFSFHISLAVNHTSQCLSFCTLCAFPPPPPDNCFPSPLRHPVRHYLPPLPASVGRNQWFRQALADQRRPRRLICADKGWEWGGGSHAGSSPAISEASWDSHPILESKYGYSSFDSMYLLILVHASSSYACLFCGKQLARFGDPCYSHEIEHLLSHQSEFRSGKKSSTTSSSPSLLLVLSGVGPASN